MRRWSNTETDDGSIHCLGNGQLCAYGQGPNLIQVFGPPYSSPALFQLHIDMAEPVETHCEREQGTAIWTHHIHAGGRTVGELVDYVDAEIPCLVRHVRVTQPLRLELRLEEGVQVVENGQRVRGCDGGLLLEAPAGKYLYHTYPFPTPICHQVAWRGPVRVTAQAAQARVEIVCDAGECWLFFAGGPDYPRAVLNAEAVLGTPVEQLLARTRHWWQTFTHGRRDWAAELPPELPQRDHLLQTADSVAVLIRAQQSNEGAVLAGHNYHMAYVRDQYGVSRGLLALGHVEQARRILEFYWQVWHSHGRIHNAQASGVDGVFHVHENDEVEITGYLIRQAFDLLQCSGDGAFLDLIFPMLEWAWEAQKKHLVAGMLPFNGDETYVAGGILPRHTLNDGSAEATLLFVEGGNALVDWAERRQRWSPAVAADQRAILQAVKTQYRTNFWRDGQLITNNPARAVQATLPRFRHGVCERCQVEGRFHGIVWTECNEHGRYLCPACLARDAFPAAVPERYMLQSVSLTPFYFHSGLLARDELASLVNAMARRYVETGKLPSRPDDDAGIAVGYDYGMMLYALTELQSPLAGVFYRQTLSLVDETGAWVEYYAQHRPMSTRCRPWESAINLEAALLWATQQR